MEQFEPDLVSKHQSVEIAFKVCKFLLFYPTMLDRKLGTVHLPTKSKKANLLTLGCGEESTVFIEVRNTRRTGGSSLVSKALEGFQQRFLKAK